MFAVALLTGLAILLDPNAEDEALKKELAQLQGKWRVVSWQCDPDPVQPPPGAQVNDAKIVEEYWVIYDSQHWEWYSIKERQVGRTRPLTSGPFTIDAARSPRWFDWKTHGLVNHGSGIVNNILGIGIYEVKGDILRICLVEPDKERPRDFTYTKGSGRSVWVFQRAKP